MTDVEIKYHTVAQVAEMFEVTQATVRWWVKENKIDAIRLPGNGHIRISDQAVRQLANQKHGDDSA